jgi:hypothetical protein
MSSAKHDLTRTPGGVNFGGLLPFLFAHERCDNPPVVAFPLTLVCLFLLPGSARAFILTVPRVFARPELWLPLAGGLAAGLLFHHFLLRRWPSFLVFEHELTHAVAAVLLLRRVRRFVVTRDGGFVEHSPGFGGAVGDRLIALSPYFLPTFAVPAIFCRPAVPAAWFPWYDAVIGAAFAFHLLSNVQELGENWTGRPVRYAGSRHQGYTDIGRAGFFSSAVIIAALTLAANGALLALLAGGYEGAWEGAKTAATVSVKAWGAMASAAWELARPLLLRWGLTS